MADVVDKATRSRMMSGIRRSDTEPERIVRSHLHRAGFRFRLRSKVLIGHPDIILPKYRAVIFVHGCFWHRHLGCRYAYTPATRRTFWLRKFESNQRRDRRVRRILRQAGWHVYVVWECQLGIARLNRLCRRIADLATDR